MRVTEPCKATILTQLYSSQEVTDVLRNIRPSDLRDDVRQHVFLALFEKEDAFIIDLHTRGKLRAYVVKTLYNTVNFSESKFNRELRRRTELPTESFDADRTGKGEQIDTRARQIKGQVGKINRYVMEESEAQEGSYNYEALVESCNVKMDAIYWYNRDLLRLYSELGSYRKVAEATKIPLNSVHHAIKQAKEEMKKLLWE